MQGESECVAMSGVGWLTLLVCFFPSLPFSSLSSVHLQRQAQAQAAQGDLSLYLSLSPLLFIDSSFTYDADSSSSRDRRHPRSRDRRSLLLHLSLIAAPLNLISFLCVSVFLCFAGVADTLARGHLHPPIADGLTGIGIGIVAGIVVSMTATATATATVTVV